MLTRSHTTRQQHQSLHEEEFQADRVFIFEKSEKVEFFLSTFARTLRQIFDIAVSSRFVPPII
jgi:hypothetical protein